MRSKSVGVAIVVGCCSASAAQGAVVRILPAPNELRAYDQLVSTPRVFAKGDVLARAYVLGPTRAKLSNAISFSFNNEIVQITPADMLTEGLIADISGLPLLPKRGRVRSDTPPAFCTYRRKSSIELAFLGKQDFERCLIDQDGDGKFETFLVAGAEAGDVVSIPPTAYSVVSSQSDPSNRIEVSFNFFAGKRTIILRTALFVGNKRQSDVTRLLVRSEKGLFDYEGGRQDYGMCFYKRPDDSLVGRISVLGAPVDIVSIDRAQKNMTAIVGAQSAKSLFIADYNQRWIPQEFGFCGDESA